MFKAMQSRTDISLIVHTKLHKFESLQALGQLETHYKHTNWYDKQEIYLIYNSLLVKEI